MFALLIASCGEGASPAGEMPAGDPSIELVTEITRPVRGANVRLVRMPTGGADPAFEPPEIQIRRGDVVRFVQVAARPESVAFDTTGLPAELAAFVRERNLTAGVLLLSPGEVHDVRFSGAPSGRYPFYSLTRAPEGIRGAVIVE